MQLNALPGTSLCLALFSNYPDIIRVAAYVAFFATIVILLTVIGIFYHRMALEKISRLSALAESEVLKELNSHLLLYDSVTEIPELEMNATVKRLNFLKDKNGVFRRSLSDVLVYFQSNLTGAFDNIISSAFSRLKLRKFTLGKLNSALWFRKIEGLAEVQEMQDGHSLPEVYKLAEDRNTDVRVAAYTVLIKMRTQDCFEFLAKENVELSEWHQIMLGDAITTTENPGIPDFKRFLTSENKSIIKLCIRLIVTYMQFNAIFKLLSMLESEDESIRNRIIIALGELLARNAEAKLTERYSAESQKNKAAILITLGQIASGKYLNFIKNQFIKAEDFDIMKSAASAIAAHPMELKAGILQTLTNLPNDHRAMLKNFE